MDETSPHTHFVEAPPPTVDVTQQAADIVVIEPVADHKLYPVATVPPSRSAAPEREKHEAKNRYPAVNENQIVDSKPVDVWLSGMKKSVSYRYNTSIGMANILPALNATKLSLEQVLRHVNFYYQDAVEWNIHSSGGLFRTPKVGHFIGHAPIVRFATDNRPVEKYVRSENSRIMVSMLMLLVVMDNLHDYGYMEYADDTDEVKTQKAAAIEWAQFFQSLIEDWLQGVHHQDGYPTANEDNVVEGPYACAAARIFALTYRDFLTKFPMRHLTETAMDFFTLKYATTAQLPEERDNARALAAGKRLSVYGLVKLVPNEPPGDPDPWKALRMPGCPQQGHICTPEEDNVVWPDDFALPYVPPLDNVNWLEMTRLRIKRSLSWINGPFGKNWNEQFLIAWSGLYRIYSDKYTDFSIDDAFNKVQAIVKEEDSQAVQAIFDEKEPPAKRPLPAGSNASSKLMFIKAIDTPDQLIGRRLYCLACRNFHLPTDKPFLTAPDRQFGS